MVVRLKSGIRAIMAGFWGSAMSEELEGLETSAGLWASVMSEKLEGLETLGFSGRGGMKHVSESIQFSYF